MDFDKLAPVIVGPDRYQILQLEMNRSAYLDGIPSLIMSVKGRNEETGEERDLHFMMTTKNWQEFFGICYERYVARE